MHTIHNPIHNTFLGIKHKILDIIHKMLDIKHIILDVIIINHTLPNVT